MVDTALAHQEAQKRPGVLSGLGRRRDGPIPLEVDLADGDRARAGGFHDPCNVSHAEGVASDVDRVGDVLGGTEGEGGDGTAYVGEGGERDGGVGRADALEAVVGCVEAEGGTDAAFEDEAAEDAAYAEGGEQLGG